MKNYVELPIEPLQHAHFMHCAKGLGMEVKIKGGKYLVEYEEIEDLFELGKQVQRGFRCHNPASSHSMPIPPPAE